MNKIESEILKLSLMAPNTVMKIDIKEANGYLFKGVEEFAIAIPYDVDNQISEDFVGISLATNYLNFDNQSFKVLYLHSTSDIDLEKFCYIGAEFINLSNRATIIDDPFKWVDEWKNIFGDSKKNKMIYDTIGEMYSLLYTYKRDRSAKWMGPVGGTHDIVAENYVIEVKSSHKKTNSIVGIHSRFQLCDDKPEKLYFCRLEQTAFANSINSLLEELVSEGYDRMELEKALTKLGYKKGSRLRDISYNVLELSSYDVNKDLFPIVSLDEINQFAPLKNILNYTLELDLAPLPKKTLI